MSRGLIGALMGGSLGQDSRLWLIRVLLLGTLVRVQAMGAVEGMAGLGAARGASWLGATVRGGKHRGH